MDLLQIGLRIAHIAAAVALGGAIVYQLVAVQPVLRTLDESQRATFRTRLAGRWAPVVWLGIALLLITGLANFLVFKVPEYRGRPYAATYHGLFGIKLLAGLALFHAAAMLSGPGERFDRYRARAGGWLVYGVLLLAIVVVVGAVLRYLPALYT